MTIQMRLRPSHGLLLTTSSLLVSSMPAAFGWLDAASLADGASTVACVVAQGRRCAAIDLAASCWLLQWPCLLLQQRCTAAHACCEPTPRRLMSRLAVIATHCYIALRGVGWPCFRVTWVALSTLLAVLILRIWLAVNHHTILVLPHAHTPFMHGTVGPSTASICGAC